MSSQQPQPSRRVGANDASTSRASGSSSSGGNNPSGNKQSGQPLKRACDQCNLRRVKCSHEHPCAHCVRLRINCTYWKAARGKESSGKRIEKLRREQALAAQAQAHVAASSSSSASSSNALSASHAQGSSMSGGNGIQQGHNPAAAYPLGSFQHPHHHQQQHTPVYVGQPKMEDGPGPGSVGVPHSLAAPQTQPSAQYAGPSAHFPAAGHNHNHPQARGHDGHRQQGSTSSSHHHGSTPSSASQASFPREAYQHQQQQDTTTTTTSSAAQGTHIPPAVFLGNAFFPPSLTTISPSTAAQFRLPDLSTSLADEFNAQDPNAPLGHAPSSGAPGGGSGFRTLEAVAAASDLDLSLVASSKILGDGSGFIDHGRKQKRKKGKKAGGKDAPARLRLSASGSQFPSQAQGSDFQALIDATIPSLRILVLVDGAFPDHLQELTPFLARGVQPVTADARQAFVDQVRTAVGELAQAGGEAAQDHHQKRIQILGIVVNALSTLPEPATDRELEGSFNLLLALILTSTPSSSTSSGSSRRTETELLTRLSELLASPTSSSAASATDRSIVKYRILILALGAGHAEWCTGLRSCCEPDYT